MGKPELLFICGNIQPYSSQGVRYINLLPELAKYFNVTLLSYNSFYQGDELQKLNINKETDKVVSNNPTPKYFYAKRVYKKLIRPFVFPDRYKYEVSKYKSEINKLYNQQEFDKVIIAMTPFSLYELAQFISDNYKSEIICDLSDPFSFSGNKNYSRLITKRSIVSYEKNKLKFVDKVVVLNPSIKEIYKSLSPKNKIYVIEQGLGKQIHIEIPINNQDGIKLIYAGGLYKKFREAFELYKSVAEYDGEIQLNIFGNITEDLLSNEPYCKYKGILNSQDLVEEYLKSDCIVFIDNENGVQVPGKVLEIQQFGIPILFIYSNKNSPSLDYLFNDNIVKVLNKKSEIIKGLSKLKKDSSFKAPSSKLADYYWSNLGKKYKALLND